MGRRLARLRGNDEQPTIVPKTGSAGQPRPPGVWNARPLSSAVRSVLEVWAAWIVISPRRRSVRSVGGAATAVIAVWAEVSPMRVGVRHDRKQAKGNCRACEKSKNSVHHWLLRCPQLGFRLPVK